MFKKRLKCILLKEKKERNINKSMSFIFFVGGTYCIYCKDKNKSTIFINKKDKNKSTIFINKNNY